MAVPEVDRSKAAASANGGTRSEGASEPAIPAFSSAVDAGKRSLELWDLKADDEILQQIVQKLFCANCAIKLRSVDDELRQQMTAYGLRRDIQTGLLNYHSFQEALVALLRDEPADREIALIWIDLLSLRREFSLRGWTGSEAVVRQVAGILRSTVDADALLGRFSGRCFLVAMQAGKFDQEDGRRIQAVVDALSPPREHGSEEKPEVAAGVAFYPSDTGSAEDLVRFACLAATQAGQAKGPRPAVMAFNAQMNNLLMREHRLEVEMRQGLDLGQFSAVYQPNVELATGRVLGAEALLRWNHPEWGAVTPSEFIPIAERSGLIHRMFDYTLRSALHDIRNWRELGLGVPIVSVNASAVNLRRDDFARSVRGALEEVPLDPAQLELEVTESVLFDDQELFTTRVRELGAIGVRIAIDDFGTRYTGFNVLLELPLATMKIDKCFIGGIGRSPDMRALCRTILAMARQLKMRTVAEGIEEPGELEALREIGCEAGQGHLFQQPVTAAEFAAFLRSWPERMRAFGFPVLSQQDAFHPLVGIA